VGRVEVVETERLGGGRYGPIDGVLNLAGDGAGDIMQ